MTPSADFNAADIMALVVAATRNALGTINANKLAAYKQAVNEYLVNATHIMEINASRAVANPPLPPLAPPQKPGVPVGAVLVPMQTSSPNEIPFSMGYGPLAPPCPDPPPLKQGPVAGAVDVGSFDFGNHGVGGFWSAGINDAYAHTNGPAVDATSEDGVTAKWQPMGAPVGDGWYVRLT